ncbi:MAG TPA: hypothetical protein VJQ44_09990 [Gemmatimonadales bacterium]|nr:hypothetical protein [Gemmatimonadales bacterium]
MPPVWPRTALALAASAALGCSDGAEPPPGPSTGAVAITTATSGSDPDADGYMVFLDGAEVRAIGAAGTTTLTELSAETHVIGLTGIAANCAVQGGNPRGVIIGAGDTASETFAVACAGIPPAAGDIDVTIATTGPAPDPDGYVLTLDGGNSRPVGADATLTLTGLTAGDHQLSLEGLAPNCAVTGDNPLRVRVATGGSATASFGVSCAAVTGSLQLVVTGLPQSADAAISVTGPAGYSADLTGSATLRDLAPGEYTVQAHAVTVAGDTWNPSPASAEVQVAAGATAEAAVAYDAEPRPTLNLRLAGLELTQGVQTFSNTVPLVSGRDGFLRVFVTANETNTATPSVRVRFYDSGTFLQAFTIDAPGGSTPTSADEGSLASSWNVGIPGDLIRPGLELLVELDPDDLVRERDETDNRLPATGRRAITVRTQASLQLMLVPVRQNATGLTGRVTGANREEYLDLIRRIYPIPGYDAAVHATFTTEGPLQSDDANGAWGVLLSEIDALRVAENNGRLYYGVVQLGYTGGQTARSATGEPAAVGFDPPSERARMAAHELGHMWGRDHAPCTATSGLDPHYPYSDGQIGVYGYDILAGVLKPPGTPDVMGLCQNPWISDYTWTKVMDFRGSADVESAVPSLLVWGRIENGRAVLEPAFRVVTRPSLPRRGGSYLLEGMTSEGGQAFRLSFDPAYPADQARRAGHFAFAVPLAEATAARLERIRLTGPGIRPVERSRGVDSGAMLRDRASGQVLGFTRGKLVLSADQAGVDVVVSDGIRSETRRIR